MRINSCLKIAVGCCLAIGLAASAYAQKLPPSALKVATAIKKPVVASLKIEISQAIQPFALPDSDSDSGLEVDIIRAAFATQGVNTEFYFLPAARMQRIVAGGEFDVGTNAKPGIEGEAILTHWPVTTFHNQAITLKNKGLKIKSISDLAALRVLAFQDARGYLGSEYALMAQHNKNYKELAFISSAMLAEDRVDVIISQPDIFRFNLATQSRYMTKALDFTLFEYQGIFSGGNQYWFDFRTQIMRDQFERGIEAIYKSGEIDGIYSRYEKKYGTSRDMFIELERRFNKNSPLYKIPGSGK